MEAEAARPLPLPFFGRSDVVLVLAFAVELGVAAPLVTAVDAAAAALDAADVLALGLGLYPAALYNSGNAFLNRSRKSVLRRSWLWNMGSLTIVAQVVPCFS